MGGAADFAARDRSAAAAFRDAADRTPGLEQVVYLGGLGDDHDAELSPHLASRHEVGRVLAAGSVPVTELRAAVIVGSGSASFEMLRNLTDVLPVMITPRWVSTRCQPVAIRDILHWLVRSISTPEARGRVLEAGGPEIVTYEDMMPPTPRWPAFGGASSYECRSSRLGSLRTGSGSSRPFRWGWPGP
jgi:uncharacterized protein YbjT (DUF2867 family)